MRICLVTLHASPPFTPLALLYLKSYLVEYGGEAPDDIAILEFTQQSDADDMVARILATDPAVVGVSCYVWNIKKMMAACAAVKARRPDVRIVLGGPEVGPVAASVLRANPSADVVVRSEGELPFAELIVRWEQQGAAADLRDVKGIVFRTGDEVVETDEAPILQDLNHLASPHMRAYFEPAGRIICVETQRGCVFRCNFCFYNKDLSIRNRRFDLDRVKDEIRFWLQQDVRELYLMDPIFNLNAERAKEICRFIAEHNTRRIPLHAEVWAEFIDDELARLMREANFQFLEVGLQSTDDTALATVDRRLKMQRFTDGVAHLKAYKLNFELQLIYGLPGETPASFRKSLNFAASLAPDELAVFPLMILPGTELWRKAAGLNLQFDPEPPYFVQSHFSMTAADIDYGRKIIAALYDLGRSKTLRMLGRERASTFADVVDEWIAWQERETGPEEEGYRVKQFIVEFCGKKQIPVDFYRGFASWEFSG